MCEPTSIAMFASSAIGAAGSIKQGMDGAAAGSANAANLRIQAQRREMKADFDVAQTGHRFDMQQGALRARTAVSGITAGSFSDLFAADATERALEIDSIKWGAANDASNLRAQASDAESRGHNAMTAGFIGAAGSFAQGFGSYYKAQALGDTKGVSLETSFTRTPRSYQRQPNI